MPRDINFPTQIALVVTTDMRRQLGEVIRRKRNEGHNISMSEYIRRAINKDLIRDNVRN